MEGLSLIPLPGMGFLKGAGKSLMKLGFKGGEKFAVKTGLQRQCNKQLVVFHLKWE